MIKLYVKNTKSEGVVMKRMISILLVLALAISMVFANGASESKTRLVVSRWAGDHADDMKSVAKGFPEADVVIDDIGYENLRQKQMQSLSTTGDYDVIYFQEIWANDYIRNGWLEPLDEYIKASGLDISEFGSAFVEVNQDEDGHIYGLPAMTHCYIMVYDGAQLEKDNKSIPTTPEELVNLARFYKEKGSGIAIPAGQSQAAVDVFASILFGSNGDYFDSDGNLDLTSEPVLYAANIWDLLCEYSVDGATTWFNEEAAEAVRTGVAPFGITISDTNFLDLDPERSRIAETVVYSPIPARNELIGLAGVWSFGVAANSSNKQLAYDFIEWMVAPEQDKAMAMKNSQTSALASTAEDPEVLAKFPFMEAASASMVKAKYNPLNPGASALIPALQEALSELATSTKTPEEVFSALQENLEVKVTSK